MDLFAVSTLEFCHWIVALESCNVRVASRACSNLRKFLSLLESTILLVLRFFLERVINQYKNAKAFSGPPPFPAGLFIPGPNPTPANAPSLISTSIKGLRPH